MPSHNGSIADVHDPTARFRVNEEEISLIATSANGDVTFIVPSILRRPDTPRRYHLLREHGCSDGKTIICQRNWRVTGRITDGSFVLRDATFHSHGAYSGDSAPSDEPTRSAVADAMYRRACRWAS